MVYSIHQQNIGQRINIFLINEFSTTTTIMTKKKKKLCRQQKTATIEKKKGKTSRSCDTTKSCGTFFLTDSIQLLLNFDNSTEAGEG